MTILDINGSISIILRYLKCDSVILLPIVDMALRLDENYRVCLDLFIKYTDKLKAYTRRKIDSIVCAAGLVLKADVGL